MSMADLLSVVTNATIGPVAAGQSLAQISKNMSAPQFWEFLEGENLDGILYYGPLEIFVRGESENVFCYLIHLRVDKHFSRTIMIPNTTDRSRSVVFSRPRLRDLTLSKLKDFFNDLNIRFDERNEDERNFQMKEYLDFGNGVRFYFFNAPGQEPTLSYLELRNL